MNNKLNTRQSIQKNYLTQVANRDDYNSNTYSELDNILNGVNDEVTPAFRLSPSDPVDLEITVGENSVVNNETGVRHTTQPIQKLMPEFLGGTITLPAASGGSIVVSPTTSPAPVLTISVSSYIKGLIEVDSLGSLSITLGDEGATEALATFPGVNSKSFQIGMVIIRTDGAGVVQDVEFTDLIQFVGGGAGGSGEESGDRSPIIGYQWLETDNFDLSTASDDSKVDIVDLTNATQDLSKDLFRLLCDKTKTVSTSVGTALTINLAPSFTVEAGDIVYATSGARAGQWRKIATVTNQTTYVLDAAWTGGNMTAADTVMVSQAVWTKDLVNFGDAAQKTRARDFFSGDIVAIAIDYVDSIVVADDVPNMVDEACVVVSASNSGLVSDIGVPTSDTFAGIYTRPQAPASINDYSLSDNATKERLFLVFFPNPSNVAVTTTANLLGYEASFYAEEETVNSGVLASAICFSDGSTTPYNCTVSSASGQTRVVLGWSFAPDVTAGSPAASIEVYVDGKNISRRISDSETPPTDIYWTEASDGSGIRNTIVFNADLSPTPYEIKIVKRQGVYDASPVSSSKLSAIWDIVVGTIDQVALGVAQYTSLQDAHDAASTDSRILVLPGTFVENVTVTKRVIIEGRGYGTTISGTFTVSGSADFLTIKNLRFDGNFSIAADGCFVVQCYVAPTFTVTDTGSANLKQMILE